MATNDTKPGRPSVIEPVAMHGNYGPFLRSFFARYFDPLDPGPELVAKLKDLSERGILVWISRSPSLIHFLFVNHICNKHGLPLAGFVEGLNTTPIQPLDILLKRLHRFGQVTGSDIEEEPASLARRQLETVLQRGRPALLYIDRPVTFTRPSGDNQARLLDVLVRMQPKLERTIFLLPHVIIWSIHPERQDRALTDQLFGADQAPGFLRSLYLLLRNYRQAMLKLAEPLDLRQWLAGRSGQAEEQLVEDLESEVRHQIFSEFHDVTGPLIRPPEQFKREILADNKIQQVIEELSGGDDERREVMRKQAYDMVDEIAAEPRIRWPISLDRILQVFWKRMYEGVVLQEEDFERIRRALHRGPVVFCPSHKSHVDYLIISQMCLRQAVPLPHIAAGINLSFWPMGPIFRHSGAFFMRRSFRGDRLYPVVFRTYLRHVMEEGFPIEFFIEGTRSRTGKLLNPKFGILSWLVEANQEGNAPDVQFFPISVDYEKVIESRSYVNELSGGEKRKEDVAALVKSSEHLRSKYGKIYIQVAEQISLQEFFRERNLDPATMTREQRRSAIQELGYSILYGINGVHTVTPSAILAFCLLTHRKRGLAESELLERARWTTDWIRQQGHRRYSATLQDFHRAIAEAATRFARDGLISVKHTGEDAVYAPVEQRRLELDYYRNNIVHHFVPAAIFVLALESFSAEAVPPEKLNERIRELSRLFKYEFLFRSERDFETVVRGATDSLAAHQALSEENGFVVRTRTGAWCRGIFRAVLEHFVECYWLVARELRQLCGGPRHQREFVVQMLRQGERLYTRGDIQLQETLNKEVIKNALRSYQDRGILLSKPATDRKGPCWQLAESWNDEEKLSQLATSLELFLNRDQGS